MMTLIILIATVVADAAIGMAAYKMAKSSVATNTTLLSLLTKHAEKLEDHENRIGVLEKEAV